MRPRVVVPLLLLVVGVALWRAELFTVSRPGQAPRPLAVLAPERRSLIQFDVTLPAVPVGMQQLRSDRGALMIHYWAPWQRHAREQIKLLDSLRREPDLEGLGLVVVCFDPFPSVSRFVARHRLRLAVLLDGPGELRRTLPCPSVPYTYVIDRSGHVAVAQEGNVDWWAPATRSALRALLAEPDRPVWTAPL